MKKLTTFLQFGFPKNWEGYVHRIGRTGRAGYEGQGLLVLFPFETKLLPTLRRRGLDTNNEAVEAQIKSFVENDSDTTLGPACSMIRRFDPVLAPAAELAYLSILAYYCARADTLDLTGEEVFGLAESFLAASGLRKRPEISQSLLDKLKLSNAPLLLESMPQASNGPFRT